MKFRSRLPFSALRLALGLLVATPLSIVVSFSAPTHAAENSVIVRIRVQSNASQVNVGSSVDAKILNRSGQVIGKLPAMSGFAAQAKNGNVVLDRWQANGIFIQPEDPNGVVWIGDRWYRGKAFISPSGNVLNAINYVDLEHYLFSVLGSEMNGNWPQEALKAQAVAARSYALYERENAKPGEEFDMGNDQGWQVYNGVKTEATGTQFAVAATAGQVLTYNGRVINAVFHSSAGGCLDNSEDVWWGKLPYLRFQKTPYDQGAPVYSWTKTISAAELSSFGVNNPQQVLSSKKTACNRVKEAKIIGDGGRSVTVSGEKIRSHFGLKSTLFTIAPQAVAANKSGGKSTPTSFVIQGYGFGHGLGMSQWGAYNMARQGLKYDQILGHYYKNAGMAQVEVK